MPMVACVHDISGHKVGESYYSGGWILGVDIWFRGEASSTVPGRCCRIYHT